MSTKQTPSVHTQAGSVVALWRYPVKSMMGEELNSSEITERGLLGDRMFAVVDRATGKIGGPRIRGNGATSSIFGPLTWRLP
jgi:MOSC domain-containing protein